MSAATFFFRAGRRLLLKPSPCDALFRVDPLDRSTGPRYSRLPSVARIASRQTLSYDTDAVRLDEKLHSVFSKNMLPSTNILGHRALSASADPQAAAARLLDRASLFCSSNEELLVAFGVPLENPNSPAAVTGELYLFLYVTLAVEISLMLFSSVMLCERERMPLPSAVHVSRGEGEYAPIAKKIHTKYAKEISKSILSRVCLVESSMGHLTRQTDRLRESQAALGVRVVHALDAGPTADQRIASAIWAHAPALPEWRNGSIELRHLARMVEWLRLHLAFFETLPAVRRHVCVAAVPQSCLDELLLLCVYQCCVGSVRVTTGHGVTSARVPRRRMALCERSRPHRFPFHVATACHRGGGCKATARCRNRYQH